MQTAEYPFWLPRTKSLSPTITTHRRYPICPSWTAGNCSTLHLSLRMASWEFRVVSTKSASSWWRRWRYVGWIRVKFRSISTLCQQVERECCSIDMMTTLQAPSQLSRWLTSIRYTTKTWRPECTTLGLLRPFRMLLYIYSIRRKIAVSLKPCHTK